MVLVVAAAAFLGAISRYLVDIAVRRRTAARWPAGTLVVNMTGSLALGFLVGVGLHHGSGGTVHTTLGTGFLGAYTTFSTFSYETVRLLEGGGRRRAALNVLVSVVGGMAAVTAGLALGGAV
jgi:CrcB protein